MQKKEPKKDFSTNMTPEQRLNRICSILSLGVMRLAEEKKIQERIASAKVACLQSQDASAENRLYR